MSLEIDYPPDFDFRWGFGKPVNRPIRSLIEKNKTNLDSFLKEIGKYNKYFEKISFSKSDDPRAPFWDNGWFPILDGVSIFACIGKLRPKRIIEIGSGNSTKFMRRAIEDLGIETHLTSIDPVPRVEIDDLADSVVRKPLEHSDLSIFDSLEKGDFVFFDGSHRCFQNSDVTAFFLDVMPRLPSGILIGIHDILWPQDYPPGWKDRYYSEQYVLGAYLLGAADASGSKKPKIWFACSECSMTMQPEIKSTLSPKIVKPWVESKSYLGGGSFIFEKP